MYVREGEEAEGSEEKRERKCACVHLCVRVLLFGHVPLYM